MNPWWLVSYAALWLVVLFLAFLLLGALRALGLLRWRLEQLEATTPSRTGHGGLRPDNRPNSHLGQGQNGAWEGQLNPRQARRFDHTFAKRLGDTGLAFAPARRPREDPCHVAV
jgi:hypothetical protein